MSPQDDAQAGGAAARVTYRSNFRAVDRSDASDLRQWAEKICRGKSLIGFAEALGVEADLVSVVNAVTYGFPEEGRATVYEVFSEKLK